MVRRLAVAVVLVGSLFASSALAYEFFFAKQLEQSIEKQVGKQVKVVDKLVRIWENQDVEGYLKFDTHHFRCMVPASETEGIAWLRELLKNQEGVEKTPDARPPLVAVYGTVKRASEFVSGGKTPGAGAGEDSVVIVVDRVEKPRDRFYEEGY